MTLSKTQLDVDRSTAAKSIHEAQEQTKLCLQLEASGVLLHGWSESDDSEHSKENKKGDKLSNRWIGSLHRI